MYKIDQIVQAFLHHTLIFWIALHSSTINFTSALMVHVNYTTHNITGHMVPEELNITLHTDFGILANLTLKRVQHIEPNLPVYTHTLDNEGKHIYKREQLEDKQGIGYYQDFGNAAVIQVTRTNELEDEETQLLLKGELNIAGSKYTLTPGTRVKRDGSSFSQSSTTSPSSSFDELYNLMPQTISQVALHDYIEAPPEIKRKSVEAVNLQLPRQFSTSPSNSTSTPLPASNRRRRQSQLVQNYYIDVVAVADYAVYNRFLAASESRTDILQSMREYYAFIFNGVDLRYRSIASTNYVFHIRLIKLIITETAAAGTFTEMIRVSSKPWDEVDAQSALSAFSDFVAGSGRDMLTPNDHVMLFTGYDLTSTLTPSANTNATTGLAYTSTLCRTDGKSVSVVEDLGGFQAVDTAAHELGHSLSARHDGDGNACRMTDRYIMASGSSKVTQSNIFNPWHFSSCSITSFTSFISSLIKTARGQMCVMSLLTVSAGIPDVSNRLPGQEHPPDDQCRMIYGSASRLCRGTEFGSATSVCTSMFCFDPNTVGTCYEQTAAMGTTCGDGKICLNGQCVYDSRAPSVDDNCVFGDQPGNAFDGMTCTDFVNTFPGYCYQALVRGRCCASCKKVYRTVSGCEYGDKLGGCAANMCSFAAVNYLEQCCRTCNYGSHFTVPPNSMRVSYSTNIFPNSPATTQKTGVINIVPGNCEDNPSILINGFTCAEAVGSNPRFCYQKDVSIACCASCDEANTGVPGCEYGDLYPSSCRQATSCASITTECCQTCATNKTVTGLPTSVPNLLCTDQNNVLVNNMTCTSAIREFPHYCYTDKVQETCCLSCQKKYSGIKDCEYGDHAPQKCKPVPSAKDCQKLGNDCCSTCSSSAQRNIITLIAPLLTILWCHILTAVISARFTTFL